MKSYLNPQCYYKWMNKMQVDTLANTNFGSLFQQFRKNVSHRHVCIASVALGALYA
ncbi:MAG: hypothetical protein GWP59_05290, partial [Chlamydiales bacterium]|nr:hypothetical protein [Chlamydiales bacterium]